MLIYVNLYIDNTIMKQLLSNNIEINWQSYNFTPLDI